MYEYIEVNVPEDYDGYLEGCGEGCWALVDEDVKQQYDEDVLDNPGTTHRAILDNDCWKWPFLRHGHAIEIELRGENRAVVNYDFLRRVASQYHVAVPGPWPAPADVGAYER